MEAAQCVYQGERWGAQAKHWGTVGPKHPKKQEELETVGDYEGNKSTNKRCSKRTVEMEFKAVKEFLEEMGKMGTET